MTGSPPLVHYRGDAYRCVPDNGPFEPRGLIDRDGENDRWHRRDEPTVYLALDPGVAVAEAGRHLEPTRSRDEKSRRTCHRILRIAVDAADLVDLRDRATREVVGAGDAPLGFLDRERSRSLAEELRSTTHARGLIVPSVAFLDDPSRANLVLFMEDREDELGEIIGEWREIGRIDLDTA